MVSTLIVVQSSTDNYTRGRHTHARGNALDNRMDSTCVKAPKHPHQDMKSLLRPNIHLWISAIGMRKAIEFFNHVVNFSYLIKKRELVVYPGNYDNLANMKLSCKNLFNDHLSF